MTWNWSHAILKTSSSYIINGKASRINRASSWCSLVFRWDALAVKCKTRAKGWVGVCRPCVDGTAAVPPEGLAGSAWCRSLGDLHDKTQVSVTSRNDRGP